MYMQRLWRPEGELAPLELELLTVVTATGMPGIEPGSSGRIASSSSICSYFGGQGFSV